MIQIMTFFLSLLSTIRLQNPLAGHSSNIPEYLYDDKIYLYFAIIVGIIVVSSIVMVVRRKTKNNP